MMWFALLIIVVCALALYFLWQGAPYVPTRQRDADAALDLLGLPPGATVVDLGAGDGAVLKRAVERGYAAVGVELNPLLWQVARLRLRRYKTASVRLANLWRWQLPAGTSGVFVFTAGPFAGRIAVWLAAEQRRLGTPLKVVSLGFALPGHQPVKVSGPCLLYVFDSEMNGY